MSSEKIKIIVIAGPTAVGKTATGIKIAQKFSGEVVNVDSMQIYEGLIQMDMAAVYRIRQSCDPRKLTHIGRSHKRLVAVLGQKYPFLVGRET